jgi:antirestriction protein ArdC
VALWCTSVAKHDASIVWLNLERLSPWAGNARNREQCEPVVFAERITRLATDDQREQIERPVALLQGCTVFDPRQRENL